jgi:aminoglycoside phosphotransferase (APT) family kinase protein
MRQLSHAFATTLAALHTVPVHGALASLGRPQGYVARQVEGSGSSEAVVGGSTD